MAIEDEEMKKRWEKRERLKRERKAKQQKLMIGLIAAGIVIVAVGVLIFFVARNRSADPSQTQPATTAAPETTPAETLGPDTTRITLAAAGDFNITDATIAAGGAMFNYTNALMDVTPLLSDADLTVMNFEGNISGVPYGTARRSAPQTVVDALNHAGVDFVQMANSWALKNGVIGLDQTLSNLRLGGIEPLGAYSTNREARDSGGYTLCTVKGVRVGLVAFTKGMDSGMALPAGSENCVNLLYTDYESTYHTVDTDGIRKVLKNLKDEKPDVIIAMVHWGSEYNDTISATQKKIRDLMFEEGVDAILGTHPHYVQSMEFNQETGQFIAYSLGDFFGDAPRSGTNYSVILHLSIVKDNRSGDTKITGFEYTPIYTTAGSDGLLRVVRLHQAIEAYDNKYIDRVSAAVYEDMKKAVERIESRIHAEVK